MKTVVRARRLITSTGQIEYPVIEVEDGLISSIEADDSGSKGSDGLNETLTQRFFDIHVHGARSHDFMSASLSEIDEVGRFLSRHGVGHYLPTTVTGPIDPTLRALDRLASAIESHRNAGPNPAEPHMIAAGPQGIHLEGPFVSPAKRGVHPSASILPPSIDLFERFQQASRGHIRLMTIAPELPGALELIRHASLAGVRVSMGHSNATRAETLAALDAGAITATHLFNAMRPLDSREPGIIGTILDRSDVYAELICDGVHVHPGTVRLWLRLKGSDRAILVTDGMAATGMPDGTYTLGDFPVEVKGGVCRSGQVLAGSVLTMDQAVENLQSFTGSSLETAMRLASSNPAQMLGMAQISQIGIGSPAEFNIFDEKNRFAGSMMGTTRISA